VIFANPSAMGISAQFTVNLSLADTAGHTLWQLTVAMNPAQVNIGAVQSSALTSSFKKCNFSEQSNAPQFLKPRRPGETPFVFAAPVIHGVERAGGFPLGAAVSHLHLQ